MSASPADQISGRTPNGGALPMMRRPKAADPLVRPKDRNKRRPPRPTTSNGVGGPHTNGLTVPGQGQPQTIPQHPSRPLPQPHTRASTGLLEDSEPVHSGFNSAPIAPYTDYPLVTTKRELLQGLRHHVARFYSKKVIDPRDESEFTRPVRLHRRDPRAPPAGGRGVQDEDVSMGGVDSKEGLMDEKERERQEIVRAERDALREAEMAQVAPSAYTGGQKKMNSYKKKTQQVRQNNETDEQRARSKLRYEEALPWHMEDFDNKNTWVGSYEAALSDSYVMLVHGQDGIFRMVPVEKWYKFTSKNHFKTLTIEEAEDRMGKKVKEPRWFMDSQKASQERQEEQKNKKATSKLFLGKWEKETPDRVRAPTTKNEHVDADDLDFEEDRFADDEENQLFEGDDEETKVAAERIKRDQLQANIFNLKDEKEYEKAELLEKKEKEAERKLGKGVKKALMKREKNYIYDSDSEDNPYSEESESDDTETERLKEEERKKEEEKKAASDKDNLKSKDANKIPSGASTKGTNTPSNKQKAPDPLKKASTNALKRPGSPNLSEASGTESSRKKHKMKHGSSSQPSGTSTPIPSRPMSPDLPPSSSAPEAGASRPPQQRKTSIIRLNVEPSKLTEISSSAPRPDNKRSRTGGAGSGSDGEGAGSGGEMSEGTAKQRIKLKLGMPSPKNGTPQGSRAGSPDTGPPRNGTGANPAKVGSRAGSPDAGGPAAARKAASVSFPTAAEIKANIPAGGISVGDLLKIYKSRVVGDTARFMKLMKENARYDKVTKCRGHRGALVMAECLICRATHASPVCSAHLLGECRLPGRGKPPPRASLS